MAYMPGAPMRYGGNWTPQSQVAQPPSILEQYQQMVGMYNPYQSGTRDPGTYSVGPQVMSPAPPMRQAAPTPTPPPPNPAPQMRAAPHVPIMGMYQGGFGKGPLGQQFMTEVNGHSWQNNPTYSQSTPGWQANPDGTWSR